MRKPDRVLATNVEFWSAVVLDVADVPPQLAPAMFACSRTAGWSAHILEQKRLGRLVRPSARYVGPAAPPSPPSRDLRWSWPRQRRAPRLARAPGNERDSAALRGQWDDEIEAAARNAADYRVRGQAYRAIAQFRFRRSSSCSGEGSRTKRRRAVAPP